MKVVMATILNEVCQQDMKLLSTSCEIKGAALWGFVRLNWVNTVRFFAIRTC